MVMELILWQNFLWILVMSKEKSWDSLQRSWKRFGFHPPMFRILMLVQVLMDPCQGYLYQNFLLIKWLQKLRFILCVCLIAQWCAEGNYFLWSLFCWNATACLLIVALLLHKTCLCNACSYSVNVFHLFVSCVQKIIRKYTELSANGNMHAALASALGCLTWEKPSYSEFQQLARYVISFS